MDIRVLFRVPEQSVVKIVQQYAGIPFDNLIAPRVLEVPVKEVAATQSAEQIVKKRQEVKARALELWRGRRLARTFWSCRTLFSTT